MLGASVSQLAVIRRARWLGHHVVAVDGDPDAIGLSVADTGEAVDFADLDAVGSIGVRYQVDGVLAVSSDRAVYPAAAVAEELGLPSIGRDVALAMTDKAVMKTRLAASGVSQPAFCVLAEPDATARDATPGFPAVLKPADSGGQRGVFLIEEEGDLRECLAETLSFSPTRRAILEEYVEGTELNGIVVVRAGVPRLLTLSDRLRPDGRGFGVGWIHSFPSSLPTDQLAAAEELALVASTALGLQDGIAFPQMIVGPDGRVKLVEIAARIPAGQMADLVRFATGINLYDIAIRQSLGLPVDDECVTPQEERPIAIRFLTAEPGVLPVGVVESIAGLEAVRASEGVLAADLYFGVGHLVRPVQVDSDRNGYVIATAETPSRALELADRAAAKLEIRTAGP